MNPAFSVIFLTTLIGAGQGLFLAVYGIEIAAELNVLTLDNASHLMISGGVFSLLLTASGLIASFFHLGHPERAWRAAAMWRTSWLSRECIALPLFMAGVFAYGFAHYVGWGGTLILGAITSLLCLALFICTGMIYACIRFLQEWASPLTLINYFLLGSASGFTLATAIAAFVEPGVVKPLAVIAIVFTAMGFVLRVASLMRNSRLKPKSTLQTAIGVHHPRILQKSQGFMGGSYNTRQFFHRQTPSFLRCIKWIFLMFAFVVPVLMLSLGLDAVSVGLFCAAFLVQYAGLLAERWFFFAQANHPQNLYYQTIS